MEEGLNSFKNFKFPGADMKSLLENYEKNVELMNEAQRIAAEASQSIAELQIQYLNGIFDQLNEKTCCDMSQASSETSKSAIAKTVAHTQKVNSIIMKSNERIVEAVKKRFKAGVDESLNMAKKAAEKNTKK